MGTKKYTGDNLELVRFPLGGIGAGMMCIEGNGSFGSVSVRNKPETDNEPNMFAAITVLGEKNMSKILEGPVASYKIFKKYDNSCTGLWKKNYCIARFTNAEFTSKFPFAYINLSDDTLPLEVDIMAWSPFIPNDEDRSSFPLAGVEYTIKNVSNEKIEAVYYFNAFNFLKITNKNRVRQIKNGFVLEQDATEDAPHLKAAFAVSVEEDAFVDTAWYRSHALSYDTIIMLWKSISEGRYGNKAHRDGKGESEGGTVAVPFALEPQEKKTIKLRFSWFVPDSDLRVGDEIEEEENKDIKAGPESSCCCSAGGDNDNNCDCNNSNTENSNGCCNTVKKTVPRHLKYYKPWYTTVFNSIDEVNDRWNKDYYSLLNDTKKFTDCFYDTTLPDVIVDAVAANLSIIKSPTILRQTDGRLWGWEGCSNGGGCCHGSCTHVWNYAQSLPHLFPRLEQGFRYTQYNEMQDENTGHQNFRANLPVRKAKHDFYAASDGQLGGIIKVYREWRICGDTKWLESMWSKVKKSLDYCIETWDKNREGAITEPHHNTYDIEFWGPEGMSTSMYLGALKAAYLMGKALGEECTEYYELYKKGRMYMEENLFNGEYFHQKVMYEGLSTPFVIPDNAYDETKELLEKEGPRSQFGNGCLSDGVLGVWLAEMSGLEDILDEDKVLAHLESVYKYNFKKDLSSHNNPQRAGYAIGKEAGLLLCSWPHGGRPSLPFPYSDEVWTGIEYQVASHLLLKGYTREALDIVAGVRGRYDGKIRNPFDEYECGHWYARAMSSYALLQGYTGVRYDNVTKTLYYSTKNSDNYKTFLSTATGYGNVEVKNGEVKVTVVSGTIEIKNIVQTGGQQTV